MKNTLLLFIGLLLVGGLFFFVFSQNTNSYVYSDEDTSFNRTYWTSEIEKNGIEIVFENFKNKNSKAPYGRQHFASHVVGELIFEHGNVEGIQYCDSSYGFGCYHGFFGRAVSSNGVAIIPELDAACVSIYGPLGTGCQHGIGHGIMEYVGGERVNEALVLCQETTQLTQLLGCTSGVFMEYNTPLASSNSLEIPQSRQFDPSQPYEPCTDVGESFKNSCYFELGFWYAGTFQKEYEQQSALCTGIENEEHRTRCFMGLGSSFGPWFQYDTKSVTSACETMGIVGEVYCKAGASWSFYAEPSARAVSKSLCSVEDVSQKTMCLKLADLTEGLEQR